MPQLLLWRHAKSEPPTLAGDDKLRELTERGVADAAAMAHWIAANGFSPDMVLCSAATRTRQSWASASSSFDVSQLSYSEDAYLATAGELLQQLQHEFAGSAECGMVLGHNPGIHELARLLVGTGDAQQVAQLQVTFPTAALAVIELNHAWDHVQPGSGTLLAYQTPKLLQGDAGNSD